MNKAGGIIGIIAGIFGFIAAIATLFLGGLGGAINADGAGEVASLGWFGILFSCGVLIFSPIALANSRKGAYAMLFCSVAGGILGGTLVAICMALSFVGALLCICSSTSQKSDAAAKGRLARAGCTIVTIAIAVLASGFVLPDEDGADEGSGVEALEQAELAKISPSGELFSTFRYGSNYTDVQRQNALNALREKIISWNLPVYEVSRSGNNIYKVQTSSDDRVIAAFVYIVARSNEEAAYLESLRTGDSIKFKGKIEGLSMRNLVIKPAILQ